MTDTQDLKNWTVESFFALALLERIRTENREIDKMYDVTGVIETTRQLSHALLEANGVSEDEAIRWYREAMAQPNTAEIIDLTN